jgi:dipeptidyl-peptidase-4
MEGFWWAPDGKSIAFEEADARPVETLHLGDALHPERAPIATPYPRAGGANAKVRLGVIALDGKSKPTFVKWDETKFPYLCSVRWDEGAPLTLVVMSRDQRDLELLVADAKGATRRLVAEHDDAWLNLPRPERAALDWSRRKRAAVVDGARRRVGARGARRRRAAQADAGGAR